MTKPIPRIEESARMCAVPGIAIRLLERLADPTLGVAEIVELLKSDPAIVARLLSVANSSTYGLKNVTDPGRAAMLLGRSTVTALVLSFSLSPNSRMTGPFGSYYKRYWSESVMLATACQLIGHRAFNSKDSEYFTSGLLADTGRLALMQIDEQRYSSIMQTAMDRNDACHTVEQNEQGFTHADVSRQLMMNWKLPEQFVQCAEFHHASTDELCRQFTDDDSRLVRVIGLGAQLVDYMNSPDSVPLRQQAFDAASRLFQMNSDDVDTLTTAILDHLSEVADLFDIDRSLIPDPAVLAAAAMDNLTQFTAEQHITAQKTVEHADELQQQNEDLNDQIQQLTIKTSRDSLTGIFNRDYFLASFGQHLKNSDATEEMIGLLFLDIDRFKQINDTHGHLAGDAIIRGVADVLRKSVRGADLLARYAGDEFVIAICPANTTAISSLATRICRNIREAEITHHGQVLKTTVSVGAVLALPDSNANTDYRKTLLDAADQAMYESKAAGGDSVHITNMTCESAPHVMHEKPAGGLRDAMKWHIRERVAGNAR